MKQRLMGAAAIGAALAAGPAAAQTLTFKIPPEPAAAGIQEFARQAGLQILVREDATEGKRTGAVRGAMPVKDGLARLLAGTGLVIVADDGRTITLSDRKPALTPARWASDVATPAVAAEPAPPPATPSAVDEVIVTGTRSSTRTVLSSMAPVDVLSAKDFGKVGKDSTRDLISTLVPSANTSNSGAGASFAVKTLSLRGLSADQTLVLVDGKRWHDTAILFVNGTTQNGQSPADLDMIPSAGISHIEVLRDGASAQYGSDALAGVINIITKNNPQGVTMTALGGATGQGDGETAEVTANAGAQLPHDGYLNVSAQFHANTLVDRGAVTPNETELYFPLNASGQPVPVGTKGATLDPREATADRHTSHPGEPAEQLYGGMYSAGLPLAGGVELYSVGTMANRFTTAWLTYRNPDSVNNNVAVYPNGYSPKLFLNDFDYQFILGAKGDNLFDTHWDLSTTFGRDDVGFFSNSLNASLGPESPMHFYLGDLSSQEWTTNLDLTRDIATPIFAKPLLVAGGVEFRDNQFTIGAGAPASYDNGGYSAPVGDPQHGVLFSGGAQGVTGFPPFAAGTFSRNNVSVYLDAEQALTSHWDASLAGRFEHYSDFGSAVIGKVSTRYEILPGLAIRGTANTGFRAPTLQQEHYASSSTIGVVLPGTSVAQLYPVQLLPPNNPAAVALGARPLKPEKSVNYSVGLVAQPIRHMSFTVDIYQITISDRILQSATLGPSTVVSTALASQGLNPQQAVFYYGNFAQTTTRGIDAVLDYQTDFGGWGAVQWTASANITDNHFDKIEKSSIPGLVYLARNQIGDFTVGSPTDKEILGADWSKGPFDVSLRFTRYGRTVQRSTLAALDAPITPAVITDLDMTYRVNDQLSLTIGGNNLLNVYPTPVPLGDRGTPPFTYYNQYAPYGIAGGFYYGKITAKF